MADLDVKSTCTSSDIPVRRRPGTRAGLGFWAVGGARTTLCRPIREAPAGLGWRARRPTARREKTGMVNTAEGVADQSTTLRDIDAGLIPTSRRRRFVIVGSWATFVGSCGPGGKYGVRSDERPNIARALLPAVEPTLVKKRLSRTRPSNNGNAPTDSLLSVIRTLGLKSLRLKIAPSLFLSLIGALSQAVLLLVISEVVVAEVEGKHTFHPPSAPRSHRRARSIVSFVALPLFFIHQHSRHLLSTSVSEQALRTTRTRLVDGFFRSNWALQSTERLGHVQHLLVHELIGHRRCHRESLGRPSSRS